jgi:hypothetical protein
VVAARVVLAIGEVRVTLHVLEITGRWGLKNKASRFYNKLYAFWREWGT